MLGGVEETWVQVVEFEREESIIHIRADEPQTVTPRHVMTPHNLTSKRDAEFVLDVDLNDIVNTCTKTTLLWHSWQNLPLYSYCCSCSPNAITNEHNDGANGSSCRLHTHNQTDAYHWPRYGPNVCLSFSLFSLKMPLGLTHSHLVCAMVYNDSIPQLTSSTPATTQGAPRAGQNVLDFQDHTG